MFKPTLKAATANLIGGTQVSNTLYRFRAEVSSIDKSIGDLLQKHVGKDLSVLSSTIMAVDGKTQRGLGHIVEAFAMFAPTTHFVHKTELSSTLEKLGARQVASNMYMDETDQVWHVRAAGDSFTIEKQGVDDIEALLASANLGQFEVKFDHPMTADAGVVAFVADNGHVETGIAVAGVKGDDSKVYIVRAEDMMAKGTKAEPLVASKLQIVAYEELKDLDTPEEFESFDIMDYWRTVYSNDPEMMKTLEEFAPDFN